jgi:hypothetical protein
MIDKCGKTYTHSDFPCTLSIKSKFIPKYPVQTVKGIKTIVAKVKRRLWSVISSTQEVQRKKNTHNLIHIITCQIESIVDEVIGNASEHLETGKNVFHVVVHIRLRHTNDEYGITK